MLFALAVYRRGLVVAAVGHVWMVLCRGPARTKLAEERQSGSPGSVAMGWRLGKTARHPSSVRSGVVRRPP